MILAAALAMDPAMEHLPRALHPQAAIHLWRGLTEVHCQGWAASEPWEVLQVGWVGLQVPSAAWPVVRAQQWEAL